MCFFTDIQGDIPHSKDEFDDDDVEQKLLEVEIPETGATTGTKRPATDQEVPSTSQSSQKSDEPPIKKAANEDIVTDRNTGRAHPADTPGQATLITATTTQSEVEGTVNLESMQIDAPEGTQINEKGSLPGEAGNRKIQKQAGPVFGLLKVSEMSKLNNIVCVAYNDVKMAKLFCSLIDGEWTNVSYICFEFDHAQIKCNPFKKLYFVLVNLTFNIRISTLGTKFGKCITNSVYCYIRRSSQEDWDNEEEFENTFKAHLSNQLEAEISIKTYQSCLEEEEARKAYTANTTQNKTKKRKFE